MNTKQHQHYPPKSDFSSAIAELKTKTKKCKKKQKRRNKTKLRDQKQVYDARSIARVMEHKAGASGSMSTGMTPAGANDGTGWEVSETAPGAEAVRGRTHEAPPS
jgi:hypothetical protein